MNHEPIQFLPIKHSRVHYGGRREWMVEAACIALCAVALILALIVL